MGKSKRENARAGITKKISRLPSTGVSNMSKQVKTTVIEKKYTDKRTKEEKIIKIDYAKVVDRLNEFRKDHVRSKIATNHKILADGSVVFKSYIWKDKSDFVESLKAGVNIETALYTADSEGTAKSTDTGDEKSFEKLETISVGRGLALLGYSVSGEIASSEEMQEFEDYKNHKALEELEESADTLRTATNLDQLRVAFTALSAGHKIKLTALKDELKTKLIKRESEMGHESN